MDDLVWTPRQLADLLVAGMQSERALYTRKPPRVWLRSGASDGNQGSVLIAAAGLVTRLSLLPGCIWLGVTMCNRKWPKRQDASHLTEHSSASWEAQVQALSQELRED